MPLIQVIIVTLLWVISASVSADYYSNGHYYGNGTGNAFGGISAGAHFGFSGQMQSRTRNGYRYGGYQNQSIYPGYAPYGYAPIIPAAPVPPALAPRLPSNQ